MTVHVYLSYLHTIVVRIPTRSRHGTSETGEHQSAIRFMKKWLERHVSLGNF